jgi:hypothetical protein
MVAVTTGIRQRIRLLKPPCWPSLPIVAAGESQGMLTEVLSEWVMLVGTSGGIGKSLVEGCSRFW